MNTTSFKKNTFLLNVVSGVKLNLWKLDSLESSALFENPNICIWIFKSYLITDFTQDFILKISRSPRTDR